MNLTINDMKLDKSHAREMAYPKFPLFNWIHEYLYQKQTFQVRNLQHRINMSTCIIHIQIASNSKIKYYMKNLIPTPKFITHEKSIISLS